MTYCLITKVQEGLVGLSDMMITSGREYLTGSKLLIPTVNGNQKFFIMSSGLRSVRDKAVTYFQEIIDSEGAGFNKLYKVVNALGEQIRKVAKEDKDYLKEGGLDFDIHTLIAGQLEDDKEHTLYLLYPEGNWVEVGPNSPYYSIGNTGYGKPILDRTLQYSTPMTLALKVAFLAFDATRLSSNDVNYPVDIVLYRKGSSKVVTHRYTYNDLYTYSDKWKELIAKAIVDMPDEWINTVFSKLEI
ncbi:MAG TPA: peptidase [Lentisphaeria bacterium]|nr:MAG: peptidase [Lentisphaerae bacterium GWF2_38_69]HBM15657.1 peptidase [Lentisphaeria bacterium]